MRTILCPGWLIDGTGAAAKTGQAVVIKDHFVENVVPIEAVVPAQGDAVMEWPQGSLIPGLINNHVHLVLPGDNTPFPAVQLQSDCALAFQAAYNIRASLSAGVTTVRDCGGRGSIVIGVRHAQAAGLIEGSRVISCAWPVTITGGHLRYFGGEADGESGLVQMIRRIVSAGADFIKVIASGGGTPGSLMQYPSFSAAEMKVIVRVAHGFGRQVAAHCIATASVRNALEARVDLIEHGSFVEADGEERYDPDVAAQLAESGIPVVTTMQVGRDLVDLGQETADDWKRMVDSDREIKSRLRALGTCLLAGSDAGWRATRFETFWRELDELVIVGMSPTEAICAASGATADALGLADRYGTIRPGRFADLVVVDGDASRDIRCISKVLAVFASGSLVKHCAATDPC